MSAPVMCNCTGGYVYVETDVKLSSNGSAQCLNIFWLR